MPKSTFQPVSATIVTWLCLITGCSHQAGDGIEEIGKKESKSAMISVKFDFDGQRPLLQIDEVACQEGMTILEIMRELKPLPEEEFRFDYRGAGETAFLKSVLDVENEGGDGRNWIYDVNGELGKCSFAAYGLKDGDAVRWKFKKYEEEQ